MLLLMFLQRCLRDKMDQRLLVMVDGWTGHLCGKLIWPKINDKYCPFGCHLGMLCLMADFDSQNKFMFVNKLCLYHVGNMELKPALILPAICLAV